MNHIKLKVNISKFTHLMVIAERWRERDSSRELPDSNVVRKDCRTGASASQSGARHSVREVKRSVGKQHRMEW